MNLTTTTNAADWHATMAMKAYRKRQYNDYRRHIGIADSLRAAAAVAAATWMRTFANKILKELERK